MKQIVSFVFLLILALVISSPAQQYRIIGTNLYDFGPTMRDPKSRFRIQGVVASRDDSTLVLRHTTSAYYLFPDRTAALYGGPVDQLNALAQFQMAGRPLSAGVVAMMSPSMRSNVELVENNQDYYIWNYPFQTEKGQSISLFAVPIQTETGTRRGLSVWDYGRPLNQPITDFTRVFRVMTYSIVAETVWKTPLTSDISNQILKQERLASNGMASAQFDLGRRYLNGDGVKPNRVTAFFWIRSAADQDFQPAITFIKTNSTHRVTAP